MAATAGLLYSLLNAFYVRSRLEAAGAVRCRRGRQHRENAGWAAVVSYGAAWQVAGNVRWVST